MNVECHAHIALDGVSYAAAAARNANQPDEQAARAALSAYRAAGITFVRDGGDKWGVSALAKQLAPEYGIDYRTPLFAIHKRGHYGSIVGRAFDTLTDYASLVDEAERHGADFIKIMTTGIMDFDSFGRITGQPLEREEVCEMVHIAHEHGLAVMSHTNGRDAVLDAIEAGADSIEHGNYIDDDCIAALAQSRTCLVPTATVARNLIGSGIGDDAVLTRIWEASQQVICKAHAANCLVACGSDAGAVGVPHGQGASDELRCFTDTLGGGEDCLEWLERGAQFISTTFTRH